MGGCPVIGQGNSLRGKKLLIDVLLGSLVVLEFS
jgi:hypothetical protein